MLNVLSIAMKEWITGWGTVLVTYLINLKSVTKKNLDNIDVVIVTLVWIFGKFMYKISHTKTFKMRYRSSFFCLNN